MTISEGLCGCSVSTDPVYFAEFGAHRAPYETAIEASRTDSYLPAGFREVVSSAVLGVRVAAESRSSVHEPSGVRREVSK